MIRAAERRPAGNGTAAQQRDPARLSVVSVPRSTDRDQPRLSPVDAAGIIDGAIVLVVQVAADRYRRRVFLTVASAERAARRARARGHAAEVVLARLAPVALAGVGS